MILRVCLLLLLLLTDSVRSQTGTLPFRCCGTGVSATAAWHTLHVGAGGFMRGGGQASDGTLYSRTDTYGAYIRVPGSSTWHQVLLATTMPAGADLKNVGDQGVYDIVVCSGNTNIAYMVAGDGNMYKAINAQSANTDTIAWTKLAGFSTVSVNPNDGNAAFGNFMACDKNNTAGNVVIVGTKSSGTFYTTDGGATWTQVSGITTPTGNGYSLVGFDYNSTVTGSGSTAQTQGAYVTSFNAGLYHSTTGVSGTFGAVASAPTTFRHMFIEPTGNVWIVNDSTGSLSKYNGSTWTNNIGTLTGLWSVAIDPNATTHILAVSPGSFVYISTNGGTSFFQMFAVNINNGDTPYLAGTALSGPPFMSNGTVFFDALTSGQMDMIGGQYGFMTANPTADLVTPSITFTPVAFGIEQTVANYVVSPPNGSPGTAGNVIVNVGDLALFQLPSGTFGTNAATYNLGAIGNQYTIIPGFFIDWCPGTAPNNRLVSAIQNVNASPDWSSSSADGGVTWTKFGSVPASASSTWGANVVCTSSNGQNLIWVSYGAAGAPYFSTNGGTTWTQSASTFGGTFGPGTYFGVNSPGYVLAGDKVTAGTAYILQDRGTTPGVYKTTNGGSTWTQTLSGKIDSFHQGTTADMVFVASPIESGKLLYTSGWSDTTPNPATNQPFFKSTNSGAAWTPLPAMCEVTAIGFGAQVPGQSYAIIGAVGWHNAADNGGTGGGAQCTLTQSSYTYGFWESRDDGATWTLLGASFPLGQLQLLRVIDGDKQILGQWYAATGGGGFVYWTPYLLKRDLDPAANDNTPVGLNMAA